MSDNAPRIALQVYESADAALHARTINAIVNREPGFTCFKNRRFAVKLKLHDFFDRLVEQLGDRPGVAGWSFYRTSEVNSLIAQGDHFYLVLLGGTKPNYASCSLNVWASDSNVLSEVLNSVMTQAKSDIITDAMFSINWNFASGNQMQSVAIEEMANDVLLDESYPSLVAQYGSVQAFINAYLSAEETVLVLQGPPGCGKTRLIRGILGEITRRKAAQGFFKRDHFDDHDTSVVSASATYTGDEKVLSTDEIFVKFVTSGDDAFIVEDADHVLKPRSSGNKELHRFLMIADGVVRTQGRKIIFSSNLPNLGDLDDALVRPGRCFARVALSDLQDPAPLLRRLLAREDVSDGLKLLGTKKSYSLASIYQAVRELKNGEQ